MNSGFVLCSFNYSFAEAGFCISQASGESQNFKWECVELGGESVFGYCINERLDALALYSNDWSCRCIAGALNL